MDVYVAAKWEEKEECRKAQAKLSILGHRITFDWTNGDGSNKPKEAKTDYIGVCSADAILVLNHEKLFGGATEMGIAIGRDIPVYVVGAEVRDNIFFHLTEFVQTFKSVDDAIAKMEADRAKRIKDWS